MGTRDEIISREIMLKRIRQSLLVAKEDNFDDVESYEDIFHQYKDLPEVVFAQNFMDAGGSFVFSETVKELADNLSELIQKKNFNNFITHNIFIEKVLKHINVSIADISTPGTGEEVTLTRCEFLAARTGTIVMSSEVAKSRTSFVFCSTHIVIATTNQIVNNVNTALKSLRRKYTKSNYPDFISLVTGPSRTADIEKQLVLGAHGPKEIYVFLVDEDISKYESNS